eukprot:1085455-Pelagomonas_calceolata.AAC.2
MDVPGPKFVNAKKGVKGPDPKNLNPRIPEIWAISYGQKQCPTFSECLGSFLESFCEEGAIQFKGACKVPLSRSWGSNGCDRAGRLTLILPGTEEP